MYKITCFCICRHGNTVFDGNKPDEENKNFLNFFLMKANIKNVGIYSGKLIGFIGFIGCSTQPVGSTAQAGRKA